MGAFKKSCPAAVAEVCERHARGRSLEVRLQDEARVGRKNLATRRGARRTRPRVPQTR